jgi:dolichyl-phosphate-mannose-protein mannosyltransferase
MFRTFLHHRSALPVLLSIILAAGLAVRLIMSPHPGSWGDLTINQGWMRSAAEFGIVPSYRQQVDGNMVPNHGPMEIAMYATMEALYRVTVPGEEVRQPHHMIAAKIPAIVFDLLLAFGAFFLFSRLRGKNAGLLAAAIVAAHPVLLLESALWGQTDVIFTFFVAAALWMAARDNPVAAGVLYAAALLNKPHALIAAPVFLLLFARDWRRLPWFFVTLALIGMVATIPFVLDGNPLGIWKVFVAGKGEAWRLSWNAYNMWWALLGFASWDRNGFNVLVWGMSYRTIGLVLFGASSLAIVVLLWDALRKRERTEAAFVAAGLFSTAFFLFNAGMHDRYMFPFVILGLPLLWWGVRERVLFLLSTFLVYANLAMVLPIKILEGWFVSKFPYVSVSIAALQMFAFFGVLAVLWDAHGGRETVTAMWRWLRYGRAHVSRWRMRLRWFF